MLRVASRICVLALLTACLRTATVTIPPPDKVVGCWAFSPTIFSTRGRRVDGRPVTRDTIELRVQSDGGSARRTMRLHGIRGWGAEPVWRDSAWTHLAPDSIRILWRYHVNAYELRLQLTRDSLRGESRYFGDISPAGWRAPKPIAAGRIGCPADGTS